MEYKIPARKLILTKHSRKINHSGKREAFSNVRKVQLNVTRIWLLRDLLNAVCFVQTTRIEFDLPEYSVRRRYQDFDWLRIKLEDSQPTHLIPVSKMSLCPTFCGETHD